MEEQAISKTGGTPEIQVTVRVPGDRHRALEMTLPEYLADHLDKLQPMSVGKCIRFRMTNVVADVQASVTAGEVGARLDDGKPAVYIDEDHSVILVLPQPVQVDVTFDGDHVVKAAGLGLPTSSADHRDDPVAFALANLDAKNLKLQPWQERIAKLLDNKARVTVGQRRPGRQGARAQLLAYAKARAVPGCGACGGGGIIQQQQIVDNPIEEFCRCLLGTG